MYPLELVEHFDKHAQSWNLCEYLDQPGDVDHIQRLLGDLLSHGGLDLACGTGQLTIRLAQRVRGRLMAVDICDRMLRLTAARAAMERVNNIVTTVQDAARMEFADGLFRWAVCRFGFRWFPDRQAVMAELARVIRPGGMLYLSDWAGPKALTLLLAELDPSQQQVEDEAWWRGLAMDESFDVRRLQKRPDRFDPVVWGSLAGKSEAESLDIFTRLRPELEKEGARVLELDGKPVLFVERLDMLVERVKE